MNYYLEQSSSQLIERIILLEQYIVTLENANKNKYDELILKDNIIHQLKEEIQRLNLQKHIEGLSIDNLEQEIKLNEALAKNRWLQKQNIELQDRLKDFQKKSRQMSNFTNFPSRKYCLDVYQQIEQIIQLSKETDGLNDQNIDDQKENFYQNKWLESSINLGKEFIFPEQSQKTSTSLAEKQNQYIVYEMGGNISFSNLNDAQIDVPIDSFRKNICSSTKLEYDNYLPTFLKLQ